MNQRKRNRLQAECRTLWQQFDPIGLSSFSHNIDDEYSSYIPQTVSLIAAAVDQYKLLRFVQNCVYVDMGMPKTQSQDEAIAQFVEKLTELGETAPSKKL